MGLVQRCWSPPLWLLTAIFVPATFAVGLARHARCRRSWCSTPRTWALLILAYCCVASLVPVWALLQPRGYLGGFVLYAALALGVIGIFFGGYAIQQPAFKGWDIGGMTGHALPVPLRDHRLRRLLGLPRPGLLGHDLEADRHASRTSSPSATARCWPRASWR